MRAWVEAKYQEHVQELVHCVEFRALADGSAERAQYDEFIAHVFETHQNSPHFLGFLFSIASPGSVEHLQHNLLEELGIEEEGGESHPALMEKLVAGAGLEDRVEELRSRARARLDEQVQQPILYGSLREIGLSALVEIVSFEYMLSRVSDRVAEFLMKYRDISEADLVWFTHHSVVDIEHAEQGLDAIADFIEYYAFDDEEAKDIITSTFRENVFIKRYFGVAAAARSRGMDR